jgi:hypothetical protein
LFQAPSIAVVAFEAGYLVGVADVFAEGRGLKGAALPLAAWPSPVALRVSLIPKFPICPRWWRSRSGHNIDAFRVVLRCFGRHATRAWPLFARTCSLLLNRAALRLLCTSFNFHSVFILSISNIR